MARTIPRLLVKARRRTRTTPRSNGQADRETHGQAVPFQRKEKMSNLAQYTPGPAYADVQKDGDKWTLVLTREFAHPPAKVWKALTEPEHLREWAPFDSDRSLGALGTARLTTIGAPQLHVTETQITRADPPRALEYQWNDFDVRWQLEPIGNTRTRLTLWTNIDRRFISMGAAVWQICLDVLDRLLAGDPIGRTVGPAALQ